MRMTHPTPPEGTFLDWTLFILIFIVLNVISLWLLKGRNK